MGMYINSATSSLALTRSLYQTSVMQTNIMKRLSSGIRINSASDDAAGLSLSQKLTSVINGNTVAKNNAQTGISFLNTADGGLSVMTNSLERIRNLAVQAANGVYSSSERQMLQNEVRKLSADIQQTYQSTNFSGKNVFGANTSATPETVQITEAQAFAGGYNDAHIIHNATEFVNKINADIGGDFILVNDIDMSQLGVKTSSVIAGTFSGTLDGNGYSARNLKIDTGGAAISNIGLLSQVSGTIKNLSVTNASITATNSSSIGLIAGYTTTSSVVDNCSVSGTINADKNYVGGLIGNNSGNILNSSATVNIISTNSQYLGAITGAHNAGSIINCIGSGAISGISHEGGIAGVVYGAGTVSGSTSSANITGSNFAGGLIGANNDGTITNSSSTGNVSITGKDAGGFIGSQRGGLISNCYATGNTYAGTEEAGGFAGESTGGAISDCYSSGSTTGATEVGGFVGSNAGSITSSYASGYTYSPSVSGGFSGTGGDDASCFYKNNMTTTSGSAIDGNTSPLPTTSWNSAVWDTSGGMPALKSVTRAFGSATTLIGLQIGDTSSATSQIDLQTAFGLNAMNFNINDQTSALSTITQVEQMMTFLNTMRSNIGSSTNKLSSILNIQDNRTLNISASKSTINDTDMAVESANLIKCQIRNQAATTLIAQTKNLDSSLVLSLLNTP